MSIDGASQDQLPAEIRTGVAGEVPDEVATEVTAEFPTRPDSDTPTEATRKESIDAEHSEVVVVSGPGTDTPESSESVEETVSEPGKVMRIGSMIKQLLDEVRQAPLDERSRARLREIYERSLKELGASLSGDLRTELEGLALPFADDEVPSESELRIAQAQLVGWLEGLFHGIQATLYAQQLAAQAQLQGMRQRGLPPGVSPEQILGMQSGEQSPNPPDSSARVGGGTYL
jgi:Protein of unknown function (DUF2587)